MKKEERVIGSRMRMKMLIGTLRFKLQNYKKLTIRPYGMYLSVEAMPELRGLSDEENKKNEIRVKLVTESIIDILQCPDSHLETEINSYCRQTKMALKEAVLAVAANRIVYTYQL